MIVVSDEFKTAMKQPVKELDCYIKIDNNNQLTSADDLISFKISCETNMCKTAMRKLEASFLGEHDLLGKWVHVGFGVKLPSSVFEYLDYGTFLISEQSTSKDTGVTQIVAYDKMINAMIAYKRLNINYPITLYNYAEILCSECGLKLGNKYFDTNGDWLINQELWENIEGITYRDIFVQIAQATASTCIIGNDDKIYFKSILDTDETLTYDNMKTLKLEPIYGEINSVVLARTPQEDNVYLKDDASILLNGLTEFRIENNEIIDKDRENAITPIYDSLHGICYYPFETNTEGLGWYEIADRLKIINEAGEELIVVVFNFNISIDGGIKETLKAVAENKTQTQYQYASSINKRIKNTEIVVNKQEQYIEELVTEVDQQSEKISELEIDIDGIKQQVSEFTDLIIKGESNNGKLYLKNIADGYVFKIQIHPYSESILGLYPNNNIYPGDETYAIESMGNPHIIAKDYPNSNIYPGNNVFTRTSTSILKIENTSTGEVTFYEIPADLYYFNEYNYDELIYEYGKDNCTITRKIGFKNGKAYVLDEPIEEQYEFPLLETKNGDYLIELIDYKQAYIYCEMFGKNDITDIFATKIELRSSIEQTNSKIETEVKEVTTLMDTELSNLDSKITQTAEQISSEVSNVQKDLNGEISNLDSKVTQTAEELTSEINKKIGSEEAQSLIKQTADSLTSEINKKVDTTTFNSTIRQTTESIEAKVSKGDIGSYIEQYYNRVLIGFNNASNYIQLDTSGINIYNGSITSSRLRMKLDQNGLQLYNDDYNVGLIGTNYYSEDSSQKGLSFDLNYGGSYMGWFQRQSVSSNYLALMYYARAGKFGQSNEGIHFSTNVYGHNWSLSGFNMAASIANEYETINDKSIKVVTDVSIDDKGQINVTKEFINVRNGMITAVPNSAADLS